MFVFAIFFAAGVWLLQQQTALPGFAWAWLLPFLFFALALLLLRRNDPVAGAARALFAALFAFALGFFHAAWQAEQRLAANLPDEWQGRDIEVTGVVAELPRRHEQGLRFRFDVETLMTPDAGVPKHIYLSTYSGEQSAPLGLKAGERWRLTVRLKQPHGTSNPHGYDFELWALENNIRAVGHVDNKGNNIRLDALAGGFGYRVETWREAIRDRFDAALGGKPYAGVLSALAIGDQSSIPSTQWQVFTRTGVNHLMSISGLHITMLAGLGFALAYWLWRRSARLTLLLPARKVASAVALLVALGYALLSGFAAPAQRTAYMVGAVAAALWLNRNFSPGQILGIAILGVMIPDPWAAVSPGFWLSFGAVALILYVTANRIGRPPALAEYATVQWAMTIGLIPLTLGLFQQVSLVSPIANAVAIPLVSLAVVPLTLLGAALPPYFSYWEAPLHLAHFVMGWAMAFLEWLGALPQAVWAQHAPPAWTVAAGVIGALWVLAPRGFPARWAGATMMLPMFLNTPEAPAPGMVRLIVFDVGQGLAVAAQTRQHTLLYDAGPDFSGEADSGNRILVPAMRAAGIARLDGMILSHNDSDHTGGAASVMQAMPVGWVSSSLPAASPLLRQAARSPARTGGEARRCQDGESWSWDGVQFEILHPAPGNDDATDHRNDLSCVLRVSTGNRSVLLAGDIERASEMRLLRLHKDKLGASVLVVPHHGSKSSSGEEFVGAVAPRYAVFTAGYRNRFGHPKKEVLQRYAGRNSEPLRSDEDGAILIEMSQEELRVERYRKTHRRYWTHAPHHEPPLDK